MTNASESDRAPLRELDWRKFAIVLAEHAAMIPYAEEPETVVYGMGPEEDARAEGQVLDYEEQVSSEVDEAIGTLFGRKKWPRKRSLVRWAATRRCEFVAERMREWSRVPSPLLMAVRCTPETRISAMAVWLLTDYYKRVRHMHESPGPFYMGR